jgi:hypothetical protein
MAQPTTPHTESQQNHRFDQSDTEPNPTRQTVEAGQDAALYVNSEGAQTGTNRGPQNFPDTASHLNTEPFATAQEGNLATRTPEGSGQGITNHSSSEESARQRKVVKDRPDAQAAVNRNLDPQANESSENPV